MQRVRFVLLAVAMLLPTTRAIAQYCGSNELQGFAADTQDQADGHTDRFGSQIELSGDTMIVSAPSEHASTLDTGAVYHFEFDPDLYEFVRQSSFWAADSQPGDRFGASLAYRGNRVFVGAPNHSHSGLPGAGAVYAFSYDGQSWTQTAKIVAQDPAAYAGFGHTLSLSDDGQTLLISALDESFAGRDNGSAYIFEQQGDAWVQTAKLTPAHTSHGDKFGFDAALSPNANTAFVTAPGTRNNTGSFFVFSSNAGVWSQQGEYLASDAAPYDYFGWSIDTNGTQTLVGAPNRPAKLAMYIETRPTWEGAVYAFTLNSGAWVESQIIDNVFNGGLNTKVGTHIKVLRRFALIGAEGQGTANLFELEDQSWVFHDNFEQYGTVTYSSDGIALAIAMSNNYLAVGRSLNNNTFEGMVQPYMFDCPIIPCTADLNHDEVLDFFDVAMFIETYSTGDPDADFNGDQTVNFFDIAAFIAAYLDGCVP